MFRLIKKLIYLLIFLLIFAASSVYFVYNYMYPARYNDLILKYSEEYQIDPYLVYAIVNVESGYNTEAKSGKDARGLMQIREITADWAKEHISLGELKEEDYFKPEVNLNIGCWYLSKLKNMYDGDITYIIAAYNAGVGNIATWDSEGRDIKNGDIPFSETEKYVERVKSNIYIYKVLYGENYRKSDILVASGKIIKILFEKAQNRIGKIASEYRK